MNGGRESVRFEERCLFSPFMLGYIAKDGRELGVCMIECNFPSVAFASIVYIRVVVSLALVDQVLVFGWE